VRHRHHLLWPLLDRWLQEHGVLRQPHQPLRAVPLPDGVSRKQWQCFVSQWERQAYGNEPCWRKRELKRHIGAL